VANPISTHAFTESDGPLTNVQSERVLRQQALSAFQNFGADDDDEDDEGGGLVRKTDVKGVREEEKEEEEYRQFLLEMGGGEEAVRKVLGMGDEPVTGHRETIDDEVDTEVKSEAKAPVSKVEREEMAKKKKAIKARAEEDFLMK
jgi:protein KRI1